MGCKTFNHNTPFSFLFFSKSKTTKRFLKKSSKLSTNIPKANTIKIQAYLSHPFDRPIKTEAPHGNQNPHCNASLLIKYKHESHRYIFLKNSTLYSLIKLQTLLYIDQSKYK